LTGTIKKTQILSNLIFFSYFYFFVTHIVFFKRYWTSADKLTKENWDDVRAAIVAKQPGVSQRIKVPTVEEQLINMDP
jgi:hypothetical protein